MDKMKYTVKYKRWLFWKTIKNVVADGYIEDKNVRFFILEDGSSVEMDMTKIILTFSKEREDVIKLNNQQNGKTV